MVLDWFKDAFGHPGGTFLIFAASAWRAALRVAIIPETKDKTLEEIGQYWLDFDRKTPRAGTGEHHGA